jgi:hypothetical protein
VQRDRGIKLEWLTVASGHATSRALGFTEWTDMSSRKNQLASQERQIRRRLGRHRLDLLKPLKPSVKVLEHGGYKLRDERTGKILFGEQGYEFSATLEEVEAWLDEQEAIAEGRAAD